MKVFLVPPSQPAAAGDSLVFADASWLHVGIHRADGVSVLDGSAGWTEGEQKKAGYRAKKSK